MGITRILAVDDEALNLEILGEYFDGESDFLLSTASSGEEAWNRLQSPDQHFDIILLDRMMPGLDGIGLLRRIKATPQLADIPVILQTAAGLPEQIREGMEAGAYYYLTKPYLGDSLLAIVHAARSDYVARQSLRRQLHEHIGALQFMTQAEFSIQTLDEASRLAAFIARACPNPEGAVLGISELLVNGIEHGNLGLGYADKTRLKLNDEWHAEVDRLAALPENAGKRVRLAFCRDSAGIQLRIGDDGQGFAWQDYLELSPERACDPNGRGIALARMMSFSHLRYEGCGNTVVATLSFKPPEEQQ